MPLYQQLEELPQMTILELIEQHTAGRPEHCAVISTPGERATYAQLWTLSGRIYAWLKRNGVGPEDVVMYCLPRGIGLYACILGTLRAGAAFVLAETDNASERTEFIRRDCACRLFVDEECWKEILETESLDGYEPVVLHNLCYIAYTSGTTGNPKGVLHEYGSLENARRSFRYNGAPLLMSGDTYLCMSPMNFVSLPIIFSGVCAAGAAVALMPYSCLESEERFTEYLKLAGVNTGYVTPSFLRGHLPFDHNWRICILSSEPADGLYIPGTACYNTYAATEAGCLLTVYKLEKAMTPAPVGKSQSDVEVFVLDENEMEAGPGQAGEICFRSPYVRGYLNLPGRTRDLLRHRVFHTGDAGILTDDGDLIVRGRIDDMFKISGYRIEPDEIADAVRKVSALRHFVVKGFVYRDISSIVVFYTDDVQADPVRLRERLLELLPEYMIPTNYIRLREFPLLETGKLDKLSLLPPEGSWDDFRKLSSADLPLLGRGRTASVFAVSEKMALKVFRPSIAFNMIVQEMNMTRAVHAAGIPSPDVYEIVRSGAGYGFLMDRLDGGGLTDRLDGGVLEDRIRENPGERERLITEFASSVKALHQTHVRDGSIPDIREMSITLTGLIDPSFCSEEDKEKIRSVFEKIPCSDTFVHGDCHPGNAIYADDPAGSAVCSGSRIRFIDFTLCGKGHPVFDLMCMYSHYVFLPSFRTDERCIAQLGMDKAEAGHLFEVFLKAYYPGLTEAGMADLRRKIEGVHAARLCYAPVIIPGAFPEAVLQSAKARAKRFADYV